MIELPLTGRCYCGACSLLAKAPPLVVTHCHCSDCRRWTGAAVATFAAFAPHDVILSPEPEEVEHVSGVARRVCPHCGSPLTARFSYLPEQVYVPVGLFDRADLLVPSGHSHADTTLPWLHMEDGLPRQSGSARERLNEVTSRG